MEIAARHELSGRLGRSNQSPKLRDQIKRYRTLNLQCSSPDTGGGGAEKGAAQQLVLL